MNPQTWRRDMAVYVSGQTVSMFGTFLVSLFVVAVAFLRRQPLVPLKKSWEIEVSIKLR